MKTKTALITGATGGIGRALVEAFTMNGYGVIATDLVRKPHDLESKGYIQIDLERFVKKEEYADNVLEEIRRELLPDGKLDVLINNAAVQILGGVVNLMREDWQSTLNINLLAPFLLTQGLLEELERGCGGVINIGSIHARLTKKDFVAYATSKAALAGMTKAMAIDLGPRVRINTIEPAAIETEMLKAGFINNPTKYSQLKECHPQGCIGKPKEVASLAVALASDEIGFLNGACISIDGGISSRLADPSL